MCPGAGECVHGCYARQGWYDRPHVQIVRERNLDLARSNKFISTINTEIKGSRTLKFVRLHDSGDFYSEKYFSDWMTIARDNPHVTFFAYTKMVPLMIKHMKHLPNNFLIVLSEGGKWDKMLWRANGKPIFPVARIFLNEKEMKKTKYINASTGDDLKFIMSGGRYLGLVYHGRGKRWFATDGSDPTLFRRAG